MNEMWNEQQPAATVVQQMQQQNQVMQQSQPVQVMMGQLHNRFDDTRMPSRTSNGDGAQHLQSFYPTSTVETFDQMPDPTVQPLQQQKYNVQMDDDHVQFIQQGNPQFTQYNGQAVMPGTMLPRPTPDAIRVISQAIPYPARRVASSTITNQSLVIDQLAVANDQSNIEHNGMEHSFVLPRQQFNASFPQRFALVTPQFPPLLGYMHNHPNFLRGMRPKSYNQQQLVQTPVYVQDPSQQCYNQTVVQTSDGVLQNSGEMICDTTTTAIKSHCIGTQPVMVASSIGMGNNGQAVVSGQHEQQRTILDHSDVSQTSTASTESQKSVLMPPVIIKPNESLETSIVQIHEGSIATIEDAETTSSVSCNEESTNDKNLPKALIKPQVLTHAIEDFVVQKPDEPFSEITSSSISSEISDSTQNRESVQLDEPTSKRIKLEIFKNNSTIEKMDQIHENNWECESSCSTTIYSSSSNDCFSEIQNIKTHLPPELDFLSLLTWTVEDVRKFIIFTVNCNEIAEKFEYHEIDGEALMLLRLVHLVRDMEIKLGPALKLFAILNALRAEV